MSITSSNDRSETSESSYSESLSNVYTFDTEHQEYGYSLEPLTLSKREKRILRDVLTSVQSRRIQVRFTNVSTSKMKPKRFVSFNIRFFDHETRKSIRIRRAHYDRELETNGLLFFVDATEPGATNPLHIWLFVRLVIVDDNTESCIRWTDQDDGDAVTVVSVGLSASAPGAPIKPKSVMQVHDTTCEQCKHRKNCTNKNKAVVMMSSKELTLSIKLIDESVKKPGSTAGYEPFFFYVTTLNCLDLAAMSSRVYVVEKVKDIKEHISNVSKSSSTGELPVPSNRSYFRGVTVKKSDGGWVTTKPQSNEGSGFLLRKSVSMHTDLPPLPRSTSVHGIGLTRSNAGPEQKIPGVDIFQYILVPDAKPEHRKLERKDREKSDISLDTKMLSSIPPPITTQQSSPSLGSASPRGQSSFTLSSSFNNSSPTLSTRHSSGLSQTMPSPSILSMSPDSPPPPLSPLTSSPIQSSHIPRPLPAGASRSGNALQSLLSGGNRRRASAVGGDGPKPEGEGDGPLDIFQFIRSKPAGKKK